MEYSLSNSLVGGSKSLNPFGLSLDLQFAADKSLTARRGPTPTFTRASTATYYGPKIEVVLFSGYNLLEPIGFFAGRVEWQVGDPTNYISVYYNDTHWRISTFISNVSNVYDAPNGNEFRPDEADWSAVASSAEVITSGIFNFIIAAEHEPRFDHDTTTFLCKGLLIEESRTNLVFPSETLTTQTRTVTATPHTLSFYGTGTVVLSGVTGPTTVTGTGAFPTKTTLTFTPTAGSLILTVTGSVTQAQLEVGTSPTSYIPTFGASAVRSADRCSITGANFTAMYNQSEGTIKGKSTKNTAILNGFVVIANDNSGNNTIDFRYSSLTSVGTRVETGGVGQMSLNGTNVSGAILNQVVAYKVNNVAYSQNGNAAQTDLVVVIPTTTRLDIGSSHNGNQPLNGSILSISYYKKRLSNAIIQTLSV